MWEPKKLGQSQETLLTSEGTAHARGRPRGRPPCRRSGSTTPSSRTTSRANRPYTRPRGRMRPRAQSRAVERAMTLPNIPKSTSPDQQGAEQISPSRAPPYQLRRSRPPRYRRGNRGSRNCSCVNLIEVKTPGKRLARGADPPAHDLAYTETSEHHLQRTVRAIQAAGQSVPLVHHVVITIEKTYSSIEPVIVPLLETTLRERNIPYGPLTYRFKEWT